MSWKNSHTSHSANRLKLKEWLLFYQSRTFIVTLSRFSGEKTNRCFSKMFSLADFIVYARTVQTVSMNICARVSSGMWCINCLSDPRTTNPGFFCKYTLKYIIYLFKSLGKWNWTKQRLKSKILCVTSILWLRFNYNLMWMNCFDLIIHHAYNIKLKWMH